MGNAIRRPAAISVHRSTTGIDVTNPYNTATSTTLDLRPTRSNKTTCFSQNKKFGTTAQAADSRLVAAGLTSKEIADKLNQLSVVASTAFIAPIWSVIVGVWLLVYIVWSNVFIIELLYYDVQNDHHAYLFMSLGWIPYCLMLCSTNAANKKFQKYVETACFEDWKARRIIDSVSYIFPKPCESRRYARWEGKRLSTYVHIVINSAFCPNVNVAPTRTLVDVIVVPGHTSTQPQQSENKEVMITIPNGVVAGNRMTVNLPNGQQAQVVVPQGYSAGMKMTVSYKATRQQSQPLPHHNNNNQSGQSMLSETEIEISYKDPPKYNG